MRIKICVLFLLCFSLYLRAEDGHNLWLRGTKTGIVSITCNKSSQTIALAKQELEQGWQGKDNTIIAFTIAKHKSIKGDGFVLSENGIQANTELGILYGAYELLRRQQTGQPIRGEIISNPSYDLRVLNHWDNMDGSIERGYGGASIFWHNEENGYVVTEKDKALWREYARANASVGINGAVLNNVNASHLMLTPGCLQKVKAIARYFVPMALKHIFLLNFHRHR